MLRRIVPVAVLLSTILLFVALMAPYFGSDRHYLRTTAAQAQIHNFGTALGAYKRDTGVFPTTEEGLRALRVKPEGVNRWAGPYMPYGIPRDPWGHDYMYKYPGEHGGEPDIISYGADGEAGGDGRNADIVSWKNQ
ncbi:MAG TPA: type II secretion system major pseudopilin GspG [Bryobacteraceae bacterium]|nr:type II secretion system major pseudopilin GspG [Bryobacteraceae bacterium]